MAKFSVGDRVQITKPHEEMNVGDTGTIVEVSSETPYAVKMDVMMEDGMQDMQPMDDPHKWYTDSELEPSGDAAPMPEPMNDIQMAAKAMKTAQPSLTPAQAMTAALEANPGLYERYIAAKR